MDKNYEDFKEFFIWLNNFVSLRTEVTALELGHIKKKNIYKHIIEIIEFEITINYRNESIITILGYHDENNLNSEILKFIKNVTDKHFTLINDKLINYIDSNALFNRNLAGRLNSQFTASNFDINNISHSLSLITDEIDEIVSICSNFCKILKQISIIKIQFAFEL
jgi:hypothetical protein